MGQRPVRTDFRLTNPHKTVEVILLHVLPGKHDAVIESMQKAVNKKYIDRRNKYF